MWCAIKVPSDEEDTTCWVSDIDDIASFDDVYRQAQLEGT